MHFASFVTAVVLLVGIARSGARYFECPMMGATLSDACCASQHAHPTEGPSVTTPECCTAKRLGHLPSAAASAPPELADAPLAHVLPSPARSTVVVPPRAFVRVAHDARAGPESPAKRRSSLMIWTC